LWVGGGDFRQHLKNYDDFCVLATKLGIDDVSIPSRDDYNAAIEEDLDMCFGHIYEEFFE
jgi:hypothetical protein